MKNLIRNFLDELGVNVENYRTSTPGITQAEGTIAIGRIFDENSERQKNDHDLAMLGGPSIPTNSRHLGAVPDSQRDDWLRR